MMRAIWISLAVGVVVQGVAFALARVLRSTDVWLAWGAGMLLRFVALLVYGLFGVKALGLALAPALLTLVAFFFVTTLVEPVLLKP